MKVVVQRVVDGDSVHVVRKRGLWSLLFPGRPISVRLFGIDAPELSQPYGRQARDELDRMAGGTLDLEVRDTDRYGRTVGILRDSRGRNLNLQMVERGMAHAFRRYGTIRGIVQAERRAREGRRGLWRDRSVETPWAHRSAERAGAAGALRMRRWIRRILLLLILVLAALALWLVPQAGEWLVRMAELGLDLLRQAMASG